jgi:hypothetical protein
MQALVKNYSGNTVFFGGKTVESEYTADSLSALHEDVFFDDGEDWLAPPAIFVKYDLWKEIQKEIEDVEYVQKYADRDPDDHKKLVEPFHKKLFLGTLKVEETQIDNIDDLDVYAGNLRLFRTQWQITKASDHDFKAFLYGDLYDALKIFAYGRFIVDLRDQSVVIYDNYVE